MKNFMLNYNKPYETGKADGIAQGLEQGAEQTKLETALNLIKIGLNVIDIAKAVELPIERIEELSKKA